MKINKTVVETNSQTNTTGFFVIRNLRLTGYWTLWNYTVYLQKKAVKRICTF
jgi:hypothetical protein